MIPNNDKPNFLDRGTLISLAIVALAYFGWMQYMRSKQPVVPPAAVAAAPSPTPVGDSPSNGITAPNQSAPAQPTSETGDLPETLVAFDSETLGFQLSSRGMGLKNIDLKNYKTRDEKPIFLGNVENNFPFATWLAGASKPLDFVIQKTGDRTFVGRATSGTIVVVKTMNIDPARYVIETDLKVETDGADFKGIVTTISEPLAAANTGSIFAPSYDFQSWYLFHDATDKREILQPEKGLSLQEKNVSITALSSHYFTLGLIDRSPLLGAFESSFPVNASVVVGKIVHQPVNPTNVFDVKYTAFAGPKSFSVLSSIDDNMTRIIDYGMFAVIAKPILWLLKYLFSFIGNWGWAIILLTIIVRLLVLPFNVYSYKSMKVMQQIQPEMTRIREKYKEKPPEQRLQMNQEIMDLMKRNKANPLGGCLPMLLQLPIFFALYQVLGQSIELYRAPFGLWIQDLSAKDPFFVLPILMGITLFVQQKITPTTMDPQQAKIMMWVPLIFSVFMVGLPSGLTLYIFISTLFGIVQQYIFMRDRSRVTTVKEAKA